MTITITFAITITITITMQVSQFLPQNLRDLLLEFLTQLWFARLLKMKQKTIGNKKTGE